jgi:hypothetical protein
MKFVIFSIILIAFASSIDASSQVKVYFFGKNITNFEIFTTKDIKNLSETSSKYFDEKLKTFIYVPGLAKPFNDEEPQTVIKSLLPLWSKANILLVDWSSCPTDYYGAKEMFKEADKILSELIKAGLKTGDTHLIGFGLGTFIAGYIAKFFNNASLPLGRVTGLNPHNLANAPFMAAYEINRNDASFVDIIHVDEVFGNPSTNGHVDFWPNGGKDQPGCFGAGKLKFISIWNNVDLYFLKALCDHFRAWRYFAESVAKKETNLKFLSSKCQSQVTNFDASSCKGNITASMGFFADITTPNRDPHITVNYFLSTKSESPFSL